MTILELFSRRQKRLRGEAKDVYTYEEIPQALRVQIIHIIRDTIGKDKYGAGASSVYEYVHKALCKEYGVFTLKQYAKSDSEAIFDYFLNCNEHEKCLDIIEIIFRLIENYVGENYFNYKNQTTSSQEPADAVNELNHRFKEAGVGYQYESGELIRVDSQFLHTEAVKPALTLLSSKKIYRGANDEFLSAHEHYRHKRYKECLNDCLKSFESLMKSIHVHHGWQYNPKDTAKQLINGLFSNGLIPDYLQSQYSSLRSLLESGVPTIRNKEGGHGQGSDISEVSEFMASYMLHLTATNLLFLAKCEENYR